MIVKIEIVTHCWNYTRLLYWQICSLFGDPPSNHDVALTIFFSPRDDPQTGALLAATRDWRLPAHVELRPWPLDTSELMRRAIGRNKAALASNADVVWFTDCDYCFGEGCIDKVCAEVSDTDGCLYFPNRAMATEKQFDYSPMLSVSERDFGEPRAVPYSSEFRIQQKFGRAIGGIQVVPGDVARQRGYLPESRRFQKPANQWKRATEDQYFRRSLGTRGLPIRVPNLFRIRHAECGRNTVGLRL